MNRLSATEIAVSEVRCLECNAPRSYLCTQAPGSQQTRPPHEGRMRQAEWIMKVEIPRMETARKIIAASPQQSLF